jgi:hypothetical protein
MGLKATFEFEVVGCDHVINSAPYRTARSPNAWHKASGHVINSAPYRTARSPNAWHKDHKV